MIPFAETASGPHPGRNGGGSLLCIVIYWTWLKDFGFCFSASGHSPNQFRRDRYKNLIRPFLSPRLLLFLLSALFWGLAFYSTGFLYPIQWVVSSSSFIGTYLGGGVLFVCWSLSGRTEGRCCCVRRSGRPVVPTPYSGLRRSRAGVTVAGNR